MANDVTNILSFEGDPDRVRAMLQAIQDDQAGFGTIDFNKVIPMPESLNIECGSSSHRGLEAFQDYQHCYAGNLSEAAEAEYRNAHPEVSDKEWEIGKAAAKNLAEYGAPTWYEWCVKNWGTKWNAYGFPSGRAAEELTVSFFTAWDPPDPIIRKLSELYPDITVTHRWADEDIGSNVGRKVWRAGEVQEEYLPEYGKESIEYAAEIMGADPADWGLTLNAEGTEYEYREQESQPTPGM